MVNDPLPRWSDARGAIARIARCRGRGGRHRSESPRAPCCGGSTTGLSATGACRKCRWLHQYSSLDRIGQPFSSSAFGRWLFSDLSEADAEPMLEPLADRSTTAYVRSSSFGRTTWPRADSAP